MLRVMNTSLPDQRLRFEFVTARRANGEDEMSCLLGVGDREGMPPPLTEE